ncbi:hypothetical protein [Faecalibacterium sp. IP-3-29]|uniref:hypothetical protein n=1 Tax=Faecalibacterium sp. IP-3-29 TaxID=2929489 RepID=UPI002014ECF6|nr:hypothetical protein [Faecalibacterium sp. IP-3-29]UQK52214.1 hypothetical protein MTP40_05540 [Faecalibacterium sp. IP-3-29]
MALATKVGGFDVLCSNIELDNFDEKDYTYTNDEIDRFLPPTLKGTIKKKEYVDGTSN